MAYDATGIYFGRMQLTDDMDNDTFTLTVTGDAVLRRDEDTVELHAITFDKLCQEISCLPVRRNPKI